MIMVKLWLAHCKNCNKTVTTALPPNSVNFVEFVKCVLCDRRINARNGHFVYHQKRIKRETVDLLKVG